MKTATLMFGALAAMAACAESEDVAGGAGSQELATDDGTIARLDGASAERPCGDRTVANVELPNGNRLALCVFADGHEAFLEQGPLGRAAFFDIKAKRPSCGLDLFLAGTAADVQVPAALVGACATAHQATALAERTIIDTTVFQPIKAEVPTGRTNYCTVSDATFQSQRCFVCNPYDDCIDWCVKDHWGWHDRTMSFTNFLGEEGNYAIETNSSCNGITHVRQWEREDYDDAWGSPGIDYNLNSGQWNNTGYIFHSGLFGQDYDFRLRADSASGAYHQHSGYFFDE
jgi:hypothetical protein